MLILSNGSRQMVIFDSAELELMRSGAPLRTPNGDTFVWTADPVWLAERIGLEARVSPDKMMEAIMESQERPEASLSEEDADRMQEQIEKSRPSRRKPVPVPPLLQIDPRDN